MQFSTIAIKETLWKKIKSLIYTYICHADYGRYLRLKSKLIKLAVMAGMYEAENLRILNQFVSIGDSVIDVGAHYGVFSYALAKLTGKEGLVYAIEPLPEVFEVLQSNISQFKQVRLVNSLVSDQNTDRISITVPLLAEGIPEPALASVSPINLAEYKRYNLPCIKLDDLDIHSKLSFIKIDAESHEASVIAGASELINKFRPVIQVEIAAINFGKASQLEPFGLKNYRLKILNAGKLCEVNSAVCTEGIYYLYPGEPFNA